MSISMSQISSEDSNIFTYFPSFDVSDVAVALEVEFSQSLATIELIISEVWDFDRLEDVLDKLNILYNCMMLLMHVLERCPKLIDEFCDYYVNRLNIIMSKIFISASFKLFYHIKPTGIDFFWQVLRMIRLLYSTEVIVSTLAEPVKFQIPTATTIVVLKCLQYPLFKYRRDELDVSIDYKLFSDKAVPCEFHRGKEELNLIVAEKLNLLEDCVDMVLRGCTIDGYLLKYFEQTFINLPTYFSYGLYSKHCSIVLERAKQIPKLQNNDTFKKLTKLVKSGIPDCLPLPEERSPSPPICSLQAEERTAATVIMRPIDPQKVLRKKYKNSGFKYRHVKGWVPEESDQTIISTVPKESDREGIPTAPKEDEQILTPVAPKESYQSATPIIPSRKLFKTRLKVVLGLTPRI